MDKSSVEELRRYKRVPRGWVCGVNQGGHKAIGHDEALNVRAGKLEIENYAI